MVHYTYTDETLQQGEVDPMAVDITANVILAVVSEAVINEHWEVLGFRFGFEALLDYADVGARAPKPGDERLYAGNLFEGSYQSVNDGIVGAELLCDVLNSMAPEVGEMLQLSHFRNREARFFTKIKDA
jgi:hypothetical protein